MIDYDLIVPHQTGTKGYRELSINEKINAKQNIDLVWIGGTCEDLIREGNIAVEPWMLNIWTE